MVGTRYLGKPAVRQAGRGGAMTINIIGQIIKFNEVIILHNEYGKQHATIGSFLSTNLSSTNHNDVTKTPSASVICPIIIDCPKGGATTTKKVTNYSHGMVL